MHNTIQRNIRIDRNIFNKLSILVAIERAKRGKTKRQISVASKIGEIVEEYIKKQDPKIFENMNLED